MLWKQAIYALDRETASVELAPLEIIGAGRALLARITKRDLGRKVEDRVKVHTASSDSALELQKKLISKLYARTWTGPTAPNPDREVLVAATRGVEPKAAAKSLAAVDDAALEERLLNGYVDLMVATLRKSGISTEKLTHDVRESLSAADWEKVREVIGADQVTTEAFGKLITAAAIGTTGAIAANAAGFALYTALTSAMASIAGALGVTLPFGVFMGATSLLAFLTGPFIPLSIGAVALFQAGKVNRKVARMLLAQSLVSLRIAGAARLVEV